MSIEDMKSIADEQGLSAANIPEEFDGKVIDAQKGTNDQYKRPELRVKIAIDGINKPATIVYSPMHVEELLKNLERLQVKDIKGVRFHFVKQKFGIGYARPIPVRVLQ